MLVRFAIALSVVGIVAALVWIWRRPPRRLRDLDLGGLGIREPAIVQFSARYCSPCAAATTRLRNEAERAGVRYEQIDLGERPDVGPVYGIRTVPTIAVTGRGGRVMAVWTSVPGDHDLADALRRARRSPLRV